jgi:hypothetical protein
MEPGMVDTVAQAGQNFKLWQQFIGAAFVFVAGQVVIGLVRWWVDRSGRKQEESLRRWKELGKSYDTCLRELFLARRVPVDRPDVHGNPGLWHYLDDFNGAMAGLMPLVGKLTMLEAHSWKCKTRIQEARRDLEGALNSAWRTPLSTIPAGPGSKSDTVRVRADCGLAQKVEETISIISTFPRSSEVAPSP